ncbi:MAG TPA: ADP-ribosylglycohydrolase family protein [Bryobacteraceae bacterium]|nr:ADP-ribosylglycohydrolase family protein [Bryobacteraceae bacterium]
MRFATLLLLIPALALAAPPLREMSRAELRDRIAGGWAGQMIGVSYGAPTEFKALGVIIEGELPPWKPERVSNSLNQDDLYVDMTFVRVLDEKGLDATSEDFGAMFRESKYDLWHANLSARRNLRRGIAAAVAGHPKYNAHANDIDFQIEADFIGLMAPGLHQWSNDLAYRAGRIMNYGDGIYGGMFVSGMYAAAFFEKDPRKIVGAGLACLPSKSPYAELVRDVLGWSKQNPHDWKKTWNLIQDKWDRRDPCPAGALKPFNIDAKLNGAYIALGLLYGGGDFGKTTDISTRAGQDSDCNPASAAGILGVALGYNAIPDVWKAGIPAIADKKFAFTDYSFNTIVESTEKRALALVARTGGRVDGDRVFVRTQQPKAARLEVWDDYGSPVERVPASDARWSFTGEWRTDPKRPTRTSSVKGAEATIAFEGTGAIVVGPYLVNGGMLDVYLDGKLDRTLDVFADERTNRTGESVWHAFGLKNGKHIVRLVVRGENYAGSKGADVGVEDLVIFR